jgi:nitrogen-specific signal transduction histidine kinase
MAVKVYFKPVKHAVLIEGDGNGEHHGGKPPVTPHPAGPAFGPGVKVAMTDAEFFQFYQAYQSPKHPVFVTSDSLIQAYFGILRKELIRLEAVEAWDLSDAISNGLKFGHNVTANIEATSTMATMRFDDDGAGITGEERTRAFEPFFRGRSAQRVPGHGLGLALIRHIATTHGGTAAFVDKSTPGARLELTLPTHGTSA